MAPSSHALALQALDTILHDFGVPRKPNGSTISFVGEIPPAAETKSQKINLSLIGTIPSLANAVLATQIYEARGGRPQNIEVDLRRGHNYIDPDIGMTPSINGQVGSCLAAEAWSCVFNQFGLCRRSRWILRRGIRFCGIFSRRRMDGM
jgi:hypothetical protein